VTVLAVSAALLGGCLGGPPPSDPRARTVLNDSIDALRDVDSFRYSVSGHARVTADGQSESIRVSGGGVLNATQQRLRTTVRVEGENRTVFVDGRTVYAACPLSRYVNVRDAWYPAMELPDDRSWRAAVNPLFARLLHESRVYDGGTTTVDGDRVDVVVARPSPEQFRRFERRVTLPGDRLDRGSVENVTLRLHVDADTDRPRLLGIDQRRSVRDATLRSRQTIRLTYRPASVSALPTVPSEEACPEPS
jgi:hypothetical protein